MSNRRRQRAVVRTWQILFGIYLDVVVLLVVGLAVLGLAWMLWEHYP